MNMLPYIQFLLLVIVPISLNVFILINIKKEYKDQRMQIMAKGIFMPHEYLTNAGIFIKYFGIVYILGIVVYMFTTKDSIF